MLKEKKEFIADITTTIFSILVLFLIVWNYHKLHLLHDRLIEQDKKIDFVTYKMERK